MVDSTQAGRSAARRRAVLPARRCRSWPSVAEAVELGANVLLIGVAPTGGKLDPEWRAALLEAIDAGLDVEAGLHTVLADDPELRRRRRARRRRAARPARRAARPERPEGPDSRPDGARRPHRRLGLRDRQEGRDARARPRGARARPALGVRRHRPDRHRDRRLGDRRRPRDLGLRRRRGRAAGARGRASAATCCSSRARARSSTPPTRASRSGCCTARRPTCWCSSTRPARPRSATTPTCRSRRCPSWSRAYEAIAAPVRPARVAAIALNTRGLDDDARPRGDGRGGGARPACWPTTRCASAPSAAGRRAPGVAWQPGVTYEPLGDTLAPSQRQERGSTNGSSSWAISPAWSLRLRSSSALSSAPSRMKMFEIQSQSRNTIGPASAPYVLL